MDDPAIPPPGPNVQLAAPSWLDKFKGSLDKNPWIQLPIWLWAVICGISEALHKFPTVVTSLGEAGHLLGEYLPSVAFLFAIFAGLILMTCAPLFFILWVVLRYLLLLLTFGRIRQLHVQVPEWLNSGVKATALWMYLAACMLMAVLATWNRKPDDYGSTVIAPLGYMVLAFVCLSSLLRVFPGLKSWIADASSKWKQLIRSVIDSKPLDTVTYVSLPPACMFLGFLAVRAIMGPWYVGEWLHLAFVWLSAVAVAVVCHRWIIRPLWLRFPELAALKPVGFVGVLAVTAASFLVAFGLIDDPQHSPVPTEARIDLLLVIESDRTLNPIAWTNQPSVSVTAIQAPGNQQALRDGIWRLDQIDLFHLLTATQADGIQTSIDLGGLANHIVTHGGTALSPGEGIRWAVFNWTMLADGTTFHESLNSPILQAKLRPREFAAIANRSPISGAIFWLAPDDICSGEHLCGMYRGFTHLPSSFVGTEAQLFSLAADPSVQQVLAWEQVTAVGVLGDAKLTAYCNEKPAPKATGPLLLVDRGGVRYIMAILANPILGPSSSH